MGSLVRERMTGLERLGIEGCAAFVHEHDAQDISITVQPIGVHLQEGQVGKGKHSLRPTEMFHAWKPG